MIRTVEQCSWCLKLRFFTQLGWSTWMSELPKDVEANYYHAACCDHKKCQKTRQQYVDYTHKESLP